MATVGFPTSRGFLTPSTFEITQLNGGLNTIKPELDILDSQSASCYNVYNAEIQGLDSRYGYSRYYAAAISSGLINAFFTYNNVASATTTFIFATSGLLYADDASAAAPVVIRPTIGTTAIRNFEMDGNIYFLDGNKYLIYNTTVGSATAVVGKVPTVWIDSSPNGAGGAQFEEFNYLTSSFTQTFVGDGYSTAYNMNYVGLTPGDNIVIVNGVTLVSNVGYTVNTVSGIFHMATPPSIGLGNVSIQSHLSVLNINDIFHNTLCVTYGVGDALNVYLAGNPDAPARLHWSDTLDPTYFPLTSYAEIGVKNDKITGLLSHANSLLVFKYSSVHAWNGAPPNNSVAEVYVGEGLIATDSLKLANGYPTFYSQRGVCTLEKTGLGYILNLISEDVNGIPNIRDGMQTETLARRQASTAFVKDKKYFLWLNEKLWIYQYNLTRVEGGQGIYPWIPWKSVANFTNIRGFGEKDDYMYFAATGNFFKFDPLRYDDDGAAIDSYWLGKRFHVGESYDLIKSFDYQYWHLRAYSNIATSDLLLTNNVSGYTTGKILVMTPDITTAFVAYDVRHPIHYKANSIQYAIRQSTVSGGFSLLATKILFTQERKNIYT